jgi:hypothetical protein
MFRKKKYLNSREIERKKCWAKALSFFFISKFFVILCAYNWRFMPWNEIVLSKKYTTIQKIDKRRGIFCSSCSSPKLNPISQNEKAEKKNKTKNCARRIQLKFNLIALLFWCCSSSISTCNFRWFFFQYTREKSETIIQAHQTFETIFKRAKAKNV